MPKKRKYTNNKNGVNSYISDEDKSTDEDIPETQLYYDSEPILIRTLDTSTDSIVPEILPQKPLQHIFSTLDNYIFDKDPCRWIGPAQHQHKVNYRFLEKAGKMYRVGDAITILANPASLPPWIAKIESFYETRAGKKKMTVRRFLWPNEIVSDGFHPLFELFRSNIVQTMTVQSIYNKCIILPLVRFLPIYKEKVKKDLCTLENFELELYEKLSKNVFVVVPRFSSFPVHLLNEPKPIVVKGISGVLFVWFMLTEPRKEQPIKVVQSEEPVKHGKSFELKVPIIPFSKKTCTIDEIMDLEDEKNFADRDIYFYRRHFDAQVWKYVPLRRSERPKKL